ncbi:hypothetical protein ABW19_dt0202064 [Dactylella cylindrospora]|nr:hypothetical protein ABW19_dt0202064 [Dactylella cylindrospora]
MLESVPLKEVVIATVVIRFRDEMTSESLRKALWCLEHIYCANPHFLMFLMPKPKSDESHIPRVSEAVKAIVEIADHADVTKYLEENPDTNDDFGVEVRRWLGPEEARQGAAQTEESPTPDIETKRPAPECPVVAHGQVKKART